jgi:hypothetical protein
MTEIGLAYHNKKTEPFRIAMAKKDMLHYARWIFEEFYEEKFLESWYHELLCSVLMAVAKGDITRLIIEMPPSYGKTEFAVKLFISWVLGENDKLRSIYATYSDDLSTETPSDIKNIIRSQAYAKVFGDKKLTKSADKKWYLDKNGRKIGGMYSTTIGGSITGFHGDFLIIDDAMKAALANNKAARDEVINFYTSSATSRLRKANKKAAIIVIMQRLHENDLIGYLLENEPGVWTVISLTGIESTAKTYKIGKYCYERPANEPLNEKFEDVEMLEAQKISMRDKWYPQYMQDPKTIETGYVIEDDFTYVAKWELEEDNKCISIDPAQSIKQTADNRAISLIGVSETKKKIELYNVYGTWFGKWTNKDFVNHIITVMTDNPRVPVFMESSGGGIITEQNLKDKIKEVNAQRKQDGKPILTNKITLFNPKTSISKNQKIEDSIDTYLKEHQIRFVIGGTGQTQVKKEYKGFHPERDSKENDCIETIANVCINDFIVAKRYVKPKNTITSNNPYNPNNQIQAPSKTWRI